ncbi:MAG TPA: tetratricopeptide repeat protein [Terracidiphilus sp.]|jgi:hypothetical protein|nr:tetratricopeptide repeat protein [Terracidiphilus sp.]
MRNFISACCSTCRTTSNWQYHKEGVEKDWQAIAADPGSRDAHYELAKALDHEGQFKNAQSKQNERWLCPSSAPRMRRFIFFSPLSIGN